MPVRIKTLSNSTATFTDQQLEEELRMGFRGAILTPSDDGYDAARAVENLHIDKKPGMIIRCSGTADVIDGVNLARQHNLLLAIRAGGHHVAGHSATDGGLLLDLRLMNGVRVDLEKKLVHVQGGATWGDVDREAQAFGLAVPGGVVSTTGVAGLTLGGGIGWVHRKWGLSCDALRAATVITANGKRVIASATENKDLFWGLRGGSGNFGIVVDFAFEAQPLGPMVMATPVFYRASDSPKIMRKWRDWAKNVPDEVTTRAMFWTMPAAPALPQEIHDQDVLIAAAMYAGDAARGAKVLQPVREFGTPLADISGEMPYRFFQGAFDPLVAGLRSYWKSVYLKDLTDEAIDLITDRGQNRPDPKTLVHLPLMGGATGRVAAEETAFGDRSAPWMLSVDGNWTEPAKAQKVIDWTRDFVAAASKLAGGGGAYLNFSADEGTDATVMKAQYGANMKKLGELKKKYDPDNRFRLNNNILPA
jgi:FAD/FMN-containing dehydrogenase